MKKIQCFLYGMLWLAAPVAGAVPLLLQRPAVPAPVAPVAATLPARGADVRSVQLLVRQAELHAPELRDAEATWQAAALDVQQARGDLYPHLDITAASRPYTFGAGNYNNGATGGLGANISYALFDAGRARKTVTARELAVQSAYDKYLQAREKVAIDTVSAYLQYVKYTRLIALYQANIQRLSDLANKLVEIVRVLPGRRSELTQALARVGLAQQSLETAQAKQREYQYTLLRLLGTAVVPPGGESPPEFGHPQLAQALQAAQHAPELEAAAADARTLVANADAVRAGRMPEVDLTASKFTGRDVNGNVIPAQVYLGLKWGAFQGFAGQAAELAARQRAASAQEKYQQALQDTQFRIRSAWADYLTQTALHANTARLAAQTDQVRKDYYTQWQELGSRSLLDVLTAENEHLNTLVLETTSAYDRSIASARIRSEAGELANWLLGAPAPAVGKS